MAFLDVAPGARPANDSYLPRRRLLTTALLAALGELPVPKHPDRPSRKRWDWSTLNYQQAAVAYQAFVETRQRPAYAAMEAEGVG